MTRPIRVGIIGANPDRGWAARSHIPAIAALPQFVLTAVATTRVETAQTARVRFGAKHAFTDARSLAEDPDVDLVVVTVKVPAHVELVTTALQAGKHVYCEWPLSRTAAEASALTALARSAGVRAVVGLQARFGPSVTQARTLIAEGRIGTVLSATMYSARSKGSSRDVPAWTAYTYDHRSRAGLVEVLGGHALDLLQHLLGPIRDLTTRTAVRSPEHRIIATGKPITVTSPDHFLATAELRSGALASLHFHDAEAVCPRTRIEIAGTDGNIALVSALQTDPWAAQLQIGQLDLSRAHPGATEWSAVTVAADHADALPIEAANVARLYASLATDIRHDDSHTTPDFEAAQQLHRLIEQSQPTHTDRHNQIDTAL
jgi:predicted dehydrogenase